MCVSKADDFVDVAVAQVPGLDQQDTLGFSVLVDDVVGLAHTLRSRLVWRKKSDAVKECVWIFLPEWNTVEHDP